MRIPVYPFAYYVLEGVTDLTDEFSGANNRILLKERRELSVSGVEDVDSFDERMIIALTDMGELTIKGEGMKILSLNTELGEMSVGADNISSLVYTGTGEKSGGFFKRLFK